jgi:hypothetical protein
MDVASYLRRINYDGPLAPLNYQPVAVADVARTQLARHALTPLE